MVQRVRIFTLGIFTRIRHARASVLAVAQRLHAVVPKPVARLRNVERGGLAGCPAIVRRLVSLELNNVPIPHLGDYWAAAPAHVLVLNECHSVLIDRRVAPAALAHIFHARASELAVAPRILAVVPKLVVRLKTFLSRGRGLAVSPAIVRRLFSQLRGDGPRPLLPALSALARAHVLVLDGCRQMAGAAHGFSDEVVVVKQVAAAKEVAGLLVAGW